MVKSADDVVISATNFVSERLCPIFQVSFFYYIQNNYMWIYNEIIDRIKRWKEEKVSLKIRKKGIYTGIPKLLLERFAMNAFWHGLLI